LFIIYIMNTFFLCHLNLQIIYLIIILAATKVKSLYFFSLGDLTQVKKECTLSMWLGQ
jgi:hypothetical protein